MPDRASGFTALVLGAAAGGGFPQWNCGCRLCRLARGGDPRVRPATQASVAVTGNGSDWVIVGASPDLRQQILATAALAPQNGVRQSPIGAVVLVGGDVDGLAGLLVLRERHSFDLYAPQALLDLVDENRIFAVLDPALVRRRRLALFEPVRCADGLTVTLIELPGKVPLYLESHRAGTAEAGPAYAARFEANGRSLIVAPACAEITEAVRRELGRADVVFFDGTLFTDDEMIAAGLGEKTGRRMGHVPIDGPSGALEQLAGLPGRRILLHINNSNPIWLLDSPERRQVEAAGFEVAYDGMEVRL